MTKTVSSSVPGRDKGEADVLHALSAESLGISFPGHMRKLGSLECGSEAGTPGCYFAPHWHRVTVCQVSDLGLAVSIIILSRLDVLGPSLCLKEASSLVS